MEIKQFFKDNFSFSYGVLNLVDGQSEKSFNLVLGLYFCDDIIGIIKSYLGEICCTKKMVVRSDSNRLQKRRYTYLYRIYLGSEKSMEPLYLKIIPQRGIQIMIRNDFPFYSASKNEGNAIAIDRLKNKTSFQGDNNRFFNRTFLENPHKKYYKLIFGYEHYSNHEYLCTSTDTKPNFDSIFKCFYDIRNRGIMNVPDRDNEIMNEINNFFKNCHHNIEFFLIRIAESFRYMAIYNIIGLSSIQFNNLVMTYERLKLNNNLVENIT